MRVLDRKNWQLKLTFDRLLSIKKFVNLIDQIEKKN